MKSSAQSRSNQRRHSQGGGPRIENVEGDLDGWLPTIHLSKIDKKNPHSQECGFFAAHPHGLPDDLRGRRRYARGTPRRAAPRRATPRHAAPPFGLTPAPEVCGKEMRRAVGWVCR